MSPVTGGPRSRSTANGRATSPRPKAVVKLRPPNDTDVFAEQP